MLGTERTPGSGCRWLRVLACALLPFVSACSHFLGGAPEVEIKRRFTLVAEPIRSDLGTTGRPYGVTVQTQVLEIAGAYAQNEIITRRSPYELRRDRLNLWAQRPREMVTDVVTEYLRAAGLFARLLSPNELLTDRPDYVLNGTIGAIERFDSGDRWFARLVLSLQLVRQADGAVLWRGEILPEEEIEVYRPGLEHTVAAMSEILRRGMERFVAQIDAQFLRLSRPDAGPAANLPTLATGRGDRLGAARADTVAQPALPPPYYEFVPGKLAPK